MVIDDENFHAGELHVSSPRTSVWLWKYLPPPAPRPEERLVMRSLGRAVMRERERSQDSWLISLRSTSAANFIVSPS
jgi:hypothetical protein